MKSFMSATLQDTATPNGATECNTCNGGAVRTAGQESVEAAPVAPAKEPTAAPAQAQASAEKPENAVVVMQGPLGAAITEALNKSLSKKALVSPVQVPAVESLALNHVQANGQIQDVPTFLSKISKSVGLVPATDNEPTAINTLLDCASKVDDLEFIMVEKVEENPSASHVPQKRIVQLVGSNGGNYVDQVAIESIQVVVNYRKLKG